MRIVRLFTQNDYWHGEQREGRYYKIDSLSGYYNDLTKKVKSDCLTDIDDIIPRVRVKDTEYIHPVTVCQVGLGAFDKYLETREFVYKQQCYSCLQWLVSNSKCDESNNSIYWPVPYEFKLFKMKKNFHSGLIQGQAISFLARMYSEFGEKIAYSLAVNAFDKLVQPVSRGGCRFDGTYLYEEYPQDDGSINMVLNGAISACWGVYDFAMICKNDDSVQKIKDKSLNDICSIIEHFDSGYYSKYCLKKRRLFYTNISSPYYHKEHIAQLNVLHLMTNDKRVKAVLNTFKLYENATKNTLVKFEKAFFLIIQKLSSIR
jgi:heparosan-N-sulfate-glucuronate 5-epimerase